jgi:hypothetical protein
VLHNVLGDHEVADVGRIECSAQQCYTLGHYLAEPLSPLTAQPSSTLRAASVSG